MKFQIIKEYSGKYCILRTKIYAHTISHFLFLLEEARKDFPTLNMNDVLLAKYAGSVFNQTWGIEFKAPSKIPATYLPLDERLERW